MNFFPRTIYLGLIMLLPTCTSGSPLDGSFDLVELPTSPAFTLDYFFDKTGQPQGGMIMLHGNENQMLANNLGMVLSNHGWSVANVNLGSLQSTFPPQPVPANSTAVLNALVRYLEDEKGQFNLVLLALDDTWVPLDKFIAGNANQLDNVSGLVLLNVLVTAELQNLPKAVPILDIDTHPMATEPFRQRLVQSKRYQLQQYRQLHLPMAHHSAEYGEDQLIRRIRGWLGQNVRGMEVSRKHR